MSNEQLSTVVDIVNRVVMFELVIGQATMHSNAEKSASHWLSQSETEYFRISKSLVFLIIVCQPLGLEDSDGVGGSMALQ